ncbi:MAG TPA: MupA/Atu3671 family FMN-dependent luciferase-like monooxygenase [Pyrinomonadaceae bacterium]|nr:MupA/Atu3671 family FMN-dependent luciferase-like monooxygenase [Pyrinomonadaceae bacterium]
MKNAGVTERLGEIAIIGMAGRFPGARNIEEFWHNLRDGVESITFYSDDELIAAGVDQQTLADKHYVKAGAILQDVDLFDAQFFGFTPREAEVTDPQHRLLLECAWEALENAGYNPDACRKRTGVYAGASTTTYILNVYSAPNLAASAGGMQIEIGNDKDYLATRISFKLNLTGPSITIQTGCSTSLVAVHLACQALRDHECDMALAGGVSISSFHPTGYLYQEGGVRSPDGHCRAFDARGAGTLAGSGVGMLVLKRLAEAIADRDYIHAIIKGSAVNNDGALKIDYTAPSVDGQAEVITRAMTLAGINPESISYVEAHGTATPIGDPIEFAALTKSFRAGTDKRGYCAVGSVKTNFGHLNVAAGVAGLIKTVQSLKHRMIPPSLHFERPSPNIDFTASPFYINTQLTPWRVNGSPRLAGISSFSIGGTNAHVIVQEAPAPPPSDVQRNLHLLTLSARTSTALEALTDRLTNYLKQNPETNPADLAYTLQTGRKKFAHGLTLVYADIEDALAALEAHDRKRTVSIVEDEESERSVVFVFPGQGAQHVNMAHELYTAESVFRVEVDRCSELLTPALGLDLRDVLYAPTDLLKQTLFTQLSLFVTEYALAKLWMSWGVRPAAMIGHSLGEYVAACLAGVLLLPDALSLVVARGQLMQKLPEGMMLAVLLPEAEVVPLLGQGLSLAAVNGPSSCVVSGPTEELIQLEKLLFKHMVSSRRLEVSRAFHSSVMDQIIDEFVREANQVRLNPPEIPYISNFTGTWIKATEATDPLYWSRQLRQTVRFSEGVAELLKEPRAVLLEVGPGQTLCALARHHLDKDSKQLVLPSLRKPRQPLSDVASMLETLGHLWLVNAFNNWNDFYTGAARRRLPLPTYPFERERFWIDNKTVSGPKKPVLEANQESSVTVRTQARQSLKSNYVSPNGAVETMLADIWQDLFGVDQIGVHDDFFDLGGQSLSAIQLITRVREAFQIEFPLTDLFNAPTIAAMAEKITSQQLTPDEVEELEKLYSEIERLSTSEVQEQLAQKLDFKPHRDNNGVHFSLLFFSGDGSRESDDKYRLLIDAAKYADEHDFAAVWIPERHFQDFGGLYPNPSTLGAALAMVTRQIQLRAGSVALPLHNPIRVAEEWSVVDNLSHGRVAISFASGWHPEDFVLSPGSYSERREIMFHGIETIQQLWSGETARFPSVEGNDTEIKILPKPIQQQLPIWITSSGSRETWVRAGAIGANILAGMRGDPEDDLAKKIRLYRESMAAHDHDPSAGCVTVMLHTYIAKDNDDARAMVQQPLTRYLRTFISQGEHLRADRDSLDGSKVTDNDMDTLATFAFERFFNSDSLIGTPEKCEQLIRRLVAVGVNEIACLIDFGLDVSTVMEGLENLVALKARLSSQTSMLYQL